MGSVYAGLLASAGHEIWAIDRWREHVDAMRKNGLRLEGKSGDRTVKINAATDVGNFCDQSFPLQGRDDVMHARR